MLEERIFTIFTSHKPLTNALFRVSPLWSACQEHHLSYLAEFIFIVHSPGIENAVAETLSRPSSALTSSASALVPPPLSALPLLLASDPNHYGFNVSFLPPLQLACPSVSEMQSSPSISLVSVPLREKLLLCGLSTGSLHLLLPLQLCRKLFNLLHAPSYPGVCASHRLISSRFVRPGLSHDGGLWSKSFL